MNLQLLQQAIRQGDRLISIHAANEMLADALNPDEVWSSLLQDSTEVLEDYLNDPRGPSSLNLGFVQNQPIHTVIAYPAKRQAQQLGATAIAFLITVYRPDRRPHEWSSDYRTRLPQP